MIGNLGVRRRPRRVHRVVSCPIEEEPECCETPVDSSSSPSRYNDTRDCSRLPTSTKPIHLRLRGGPFSMTANALIISSTEITPLRPPVSLSRQTTDARPPPPHRLKFLTGTNEYESQSDQPLEFSGHLALAPNWPEFNHHQTRPDPTSLRHSPFGMDPCGLLSPNVRIKHDGLCRGPL